MTAQEEKGEGVVMRGEMFLGRQFKGGCGFLSPSSGALTPPLIDHASGGDGDQPSSRVVGHSLLGPLLRRVEQRLLHRVLTGIELPVAVHQNAEDLRRQLAQQVLDAGFRDQNSGGASMPRRTSMGTLTKPTIRDAISSARASFSTSTIQ